MATEDTPLEYAINTLVSAFHRETNNRPSMSVSQFRTFVSRHIPSAAMMVEDRDSLRQLLHMMRVENGQNVHFDNFWRFVKLEANKELVHDMRRDSGCVLL